MEGFAITLLICAAVLGSTIISARVAYILATRWERSAYDRKLFCWFTGVVTAVIVYHGALVASSMGGFPLAVLSLAASMGGTVLAWAYIVVGIKTIDRALILLNRRLRSNLQG